MASFPSLRIVAMPVAVQIPVLPALVFVPEVDTRGPRFVAALPVPRRTVSPCCRLLSEAPGLMAMMEVPLQFTSCVTVFR